MQFHRSISLFVLGALLSIGPPSGLKAQPNNRDPSRNRFQTSQTARVVLSAALGKSGVQVKDEGPVIVNSDLVTLNVSVLDGSGRSVTGLDKGAFKILDEKSLQEITFFSDADTPISISVVFDSSGSMSGKKIKRERTEDRSLPATAHWCGTSHQS